MNFAEKIDSMGHFVSGLKFTQKIVFSDENNLVSPDKVENAGQKTIATEKPKGLWFSHGYAWASYLHQEMSSGCTWARKRLSGIESVYELILDPKRIVRIKTLAQFRDFEKQYATKYLEGIWWNRVAKDWDGIDIKYLITRAGPSKGEPSYWYWNWDVSGGCVWNSECVKDIILLQRWTPFWK